MLIPTITVLFGIDVKLAGSLALLVSLPTMLVAMHPRRGASDFFLFLITGIHSRDFCHPTGVTSTATDIL